MASRYNYFVILAEMRTGSNFLEENINEFSGLNCHGELFNPHFLGGPNKSEKFGITLSQREKNPFDLLSSVKAVPHGLNGFRFFPDHDHRVLGNCLNDVKCAKIILTRNPLESFVSREIVRKTQQWRLGDLKNLKSAKIIFELDKFLEHLDRLRQFQSEVQKCLQVTGQAAFHLTYEDISDVEIINGLARFLGIDGAKKKPTNKTKKQNPQPLNEKVENFAEMEQQLESIDFFSLNPLPTFEPHRGPVIPTYVAAKNTPILFVPIPSGPNERILKWIADVDGTSIEELPTQFNQKTLRQWKRQSVGHRTFTVIRHPVPRLYSAFIRHILLPGPEQFSAIRKTLIEVYDLPIPEGNYSAENLRNAFVAFAGFIKGNLVGQSGIRIDPVWASQSELLRGIALFKTPDYVIREDDLKAELDSLARSFSVHSPDLAKEAEEEPVSLKNIYDAQVEKAVKSAYQRDYMMFGFGHWRP